ncbi:YihY/virulence factor BrkB family protein [Sulfitobacter sp. TSTF-M16]|uniref:YihY/virulence factor BrkB family protein n=2 Tax=Sulfitobacter aestuariivivens TaxID=2766981 RepID=A0A927D7R1_9RHOB|nr:YihY/virulence factor BrkB family protein [Sulfitobacter aestuariivivens]MBD3665117.1 YihY/virulence factor BrkB family protein [Sulfitobacter aestuariivivens]
MYWRALKASLSQIADNDISLISAGVAFFGMLSLFPALAALIALLGLISDPVVVVAQLAEMRPLLPRDVYEILNDQVVALVTARADTLGWAGLLSLMVAIWSARAGVGAMMSGLNNVYNQRNRGAARHYLRALMLTLGLMGVGIVALLAVVVVPVVLAFFPLGAVGTLLIDLIRFSTAIIVLFAGVGVLYRFGPNRRPARMPWLSFGAIVAVFSWAILSYGFSYYVANFGNYNQVYGSIGAVIAMLIWLWISSFLILFGGSLNAQIELRTVEDSTIGKPKPMGRRGANAADNLVIDTKESS